MYPPVDTAFYRPADRDPDAGSSFLVVSALVPYKRIDVAIEACARVGASLTIVGKGPEAERLQRMAGPQVRFLGWVPDEEILALYQSAAAVLMPGVEDFGLVPVEAQACGCPVVALGRGGVLDSVIDGATGVLVEDASVDAFADGMRAIQRMQLDRAAIRRHAESFSRERFLREFRDVVEDAVRESANPAARRHRSPGEGPPQAQPAAREDEQ